MELNHDNHNRVNRRGKTVGIEAQLAGGAVVVADNVGIGAASASDYLGLVRSKYRSHTEWFDINLPWGQRDTMEITIIQPRGK